jgi:hypothetical protein
MWNGPVMNKGNTSTPGRPPDRSMVIGRLDGMIYVQVYIG